MDRVWGAEVKFGENRPLLHTLYGLWLYAFKSDDWSLVQSNWPEIRAAYAQRVGQGNLYGTMGAHVGMVRLADRFKDSETRSTALDQLRTQLEVGTNFSRVENLCRSNYYHEYYAPRNASGGALYHGAMFLNVSPEIGRYLHDHVGDAVLRRHTEGKQRFPLWWLLQAPYFCRWTGDEKRVADTIEEHLEGVLAHWQDRLTTGFMEGLNSVFSAVKRKARGYRTSVYMITMLYFVAGKLAIPSFPTHSK